MSELAAQAVPIAVALPVAAVAREEVGNVDIKPKGINQSATIDDLVSSLDERIKQEARRVAGSLNAEALKGLANSKFTD
jgi:hypothetical protein